MTHYDKTFALFYATLPRLGPDFVLSLSGTDFTNGSYWFWG